jgi:hypothetical protein
VLWGSAKRVDKLFMEGDGSLRAYSKSLLAKHGWDLSSLARDGELVPVHYPVPVRLSL